MFNTNSKTIFSKRASKLCIFAFLLLFVFLILWLFIPKVAFGSEQSVLDKIKVNNCPCYQGDGEEGLKGWQDLYPTQNWPYAEKLFITEDKKKSIFLHDWSSVTCYGLINECNANNWADHYNIKDGLPYYDQIIFCLENKTINDTKKHYLVTGAEDLKNVKNFDPVFTKHKDLTKDYFYLRQYASMYTPFKIDTCYNILSCDYLYCDSDKITWDFEGYITGNGYDPGILLQSLNKDLQSTSNYYVKDTERHSQGEDDYGWTYNLCPARSEVDWFNYDSSSSIISISPKDGLEIAQKDGNIIVFSNNPHLTIADQQDWISIIRSNDIFPGTGKYEYKIMFDFNKFAHNSKSLKELREHDAGFCQYVVTQVPDVSPVIDIDGDCVNISLPVDVTCMSSTTDFIINSDGLVEEVDKDPTVLYAKSIQFLLCSLNYPESHSFKVCGGSSKRSESLLDEYMYIIDLSESEKIVSYDVDLYDDFSLSNKVSTITVESCSSYFSLPDSIESEDENQEFLCWMDLSGNIYRKTSTVSASGPKKLFAWWQPKQHRLNVSFHFNNTNVKDMVIEERLNNTIVFPEIDSIDGHKIIGWYDNENFEGTKFEPGSILYYEVADLYAKYDNNNEEGVSVVFSSGKGVFSDNQKSISIKEKDGENFVFPDTPVCEQNVFVGWVYTDNVTKKTYILDKNQKFDKNNFFTNQTISAVFIKKDAVIYFVNGGQWENFPGDFRTVAVEKITGSSKTIPDYFEKPTKEGFEFVGWSLLNSNEEIWSDKNEIKGGLCFVPIWKSLDKN